MIKGFFQSSKVLESYEMLVDFFHVTEHLSRAADAAYGEQTDWSKWYYKKWRDALKKEPDAPMAIVRSLKGLPKFKVIPNKLQIQLHPKD